MMVVEVPSAPRAMLPDVVPDATPAPFTFIVAFRSCAVGVICTDAVALLTVVV